jgi:hypothetical protein
MLVPIEDEEIAKKFTEIYQRNTTFTLATIQNQSVRMKMVIVMTNLYFVLLPITS